VLINFLKGWLVSDYLLTNFLRDLFEFTIYFRLSNNLIIELLLYKILCDFKRFNFLSKTVYFQWKFLNYLVLMRDIWGNNRLIGRNKKVSSSRNFRFSRRDKLLVDINIWLCTIKELWRISLDVWTLILQLFLILYTDVMVWVVPAVDYGKVFVGLYCPTFWFSFFFLYHYWFVELLAWFDMLMAWILILTLLVFGLFLVILDILHGKISVVMLNWRWNMAILYSLIISAHY